MIYQLPKGKPDLADALDWYQERPDNKEHRPARLALANPACMIAEGAGVDVVRRRDIQANLVYLTHEVDGKGWGNL